MKQAESKNNLTPAQHITNQITELTDWRGKLLARLRKVILAAAPGITEDWKWGTAVYVSQGNAVALGAFKDHVKINFFQGAALTDPHGSFNAGLDAKATRATWRATLAITLLCPPRGVACVGSRLGD